MKTIHTPQKHGQILIIFAVGLVVLLIVAALVLDGSQIYLHRRSAQAAADAGAMAGAYEMCSGGGDPIATAIYYAENLNQAIVPDDEPPQILYNSDAETNEVWIKVVIHQSTFFAQLLGFGEMDIPAEAAAGCFPPAGMNSVLPIAWVCKPPVEGGPPSSKDQCAIQSFKWQEEFVPLKTGSPSMVYDVFGIDYSTPFDFEHNYLPQIYIIMDSNDLAVDTASICNIPGDPIDPNKLICDLNGDGKIDLVSGGDRSWLDLDGGGGGASELGSWLEDGYPGTLRIHSWFASQTGEIGNIYNRLKNMQNLPVTGPNPVKILPVYNAICHGNPTSIACQNAAHSGFPLDTGESDNFPPPSGTSTVYFHITGFAQFYISCVDGPGKSDCPGRARLDFLNKDNKDYKPNSLNSVEGYFVDGYPINTSNVGTGGMDLGVYVRSLTR